jgi:hypothetical protein
VSAIHLGEGVAGAAGDGHNERDVAGLGQFPRGIVHVDPRNQAHRARPLPVLRMAAKVWGSSLVAADMPEDQHRQTIEIFGAPAAEQTTYMRPSAPNKTLKARAQTDRNWSSFLTIIGALRGSRKLPRGE